MSTSTTKPTTAQPTRYAIRQVLDQELHKEKILQASLSRQARGNGSLISSDTNAPITTLSDDKENLQPGTDPKVVKVKRDFFGRPIGTTITIPSTLLPEGGRIDASTIAQSTALKGKAKTSHNGDNQGDGKGRIWVSFHEGFSNAVRKPITLRDLMDGL